MLGLSGGKLQPSNCHDTFKPVRSAIAIRNHASAFKFQYSQFEYAFPDN